MPIDDERQRFRRAKTTPNIKLQTAVSTKDESDPKDRMRESLQELQETLLLQRDERAGFREEEEKRTEAHKVAAKYGRRERNEKYERLQQAFERMNRWRDEERNESKETQGTRTLSHLCQDLVQCD